ncbi:hypothetical protein I4U23_010281 [Adineta vaga]|nr:hypothetical protein I4U23_010281 [Adineta vaga]
MASEIILKHSQTNENNIDTTMKNIHEETEATVPITSPLLLSSSNNETLSRQMSLSSTSSKTSDNPDICRICHCESTPDEPLISPCLCLGTMQYLHQSCLQRWIKSAGVKSCELCKFEFIMHSEIKPFNQWQKLDMNVVERRKIMCSVAFNLIAVTCVLWSFYVLIEKTREEVKQGKLQWPFWTKLIVVAIGFTGGLVFLYVQCKMYLQLCIRWRQFNQRIVIHSISDQRQNGVSLSSEIKNSINNTNNNSGNCIITVLDANDLPPLNSNTSLNGMTGNISTDRNSPQTSINRNRRQEPNRNVLHRFLIFHRSDQLQN